MKVKLMLIYTLIKLAQHVPNLKKALARLFLSFASLKVESYSSQRKRRKAALRPSFPEGMCTLASFLGFLVLPINWLTFSGSAKCIALTR